MVYLRTVRPFQCGKWMTAAGYMAKGKYPRSESGSGKGPCSVYMQMPRRLNSPSWLPHPRGCAAAKAQNTSAGLVDVGLVRERGSFWRGTLDAMSDCATRPAPEEMSSHFASCGFMCRTRAESRKWTQVRKEKWNPVLASKTFQNESVEEARVVSSQRS